MEKEISEKDKLIVSLQKQIQELSSKCNALEQEDALLSHEMHKTKKPLKRLVKTRSIITIL